MEPQIPLPFHSPSIFSVDIPIDPIIFPVNQHGSHQNDAAENAIQERDLSFEDECQYNLNHQYEQWRESRWENPPICIPEAMDVIDKSFIRTTDEEAADFGRVLHKRKEKILKGQTAERMVHAAFQTSLVGGIVIFDFDLSTLRKNISVRKTSTMEMLDKLKSISDGINFQIDALFFHPELGMVVLECKSNDLRGGPKTINNVYKNAKKQTEKAVGILRDLVKTLTDGRCTVDINYVLCFPNADKKRLQSVDEQCTILDKTALSDKEAFHEFWERRIASKRNENDSRVSNLFEDANFCRFIAVVYGFRATHFISSASNAMEIHRMISTHEASQTVGQHCKLNNIISFNSDSKDDSKETTIFLNSEQLKAYEMAKKSGNVIIFGPPGSGKTLLIMLLAKEASEIAKPGQVLVIVPSNSLANMYERFFHANRSNQKRTIVINPRIGDIRKAAEVASEDDVFADEEFTGTWIPRKRPQPQGTIVAAVTVGRYCDPVAAERAKVLLEQRLHTNHYDFVQLKTVMRNTKRICNYYQRFQSPNESILIGHNIDGNCVEEHLVDNIEKACELVNNRIHQLLTVPLTETAGRLKHKDIAIIVAHEPVLSQVQLIKKFLVKKGIPTGSVIQQIQGRTDDSSLVAVDSSTNVLSFEWCVVFVVDASNCYYSEMLTNPVVPCSRAISRLIAISTVECNKDGHFWGCGKLGGVLLRSVSTPNYIASSAGRDSGLWGSWSPIAGLFHRIFLAIAILLLLIVPEIGIFFLSGPASNQETHFRIVGLVLFIIDSLLIFASQNTWYLRKPARKFFVVKALTIISIIVGTAYIGLTYNWFYSLFLIVPSSFCVIFFRLHAFGLAALEHPRSSSGITMFTMCYLIYVIIPMLFAIISSFFIGTGTYVLILSFFIPVWFHIITFVCAGETLNCFRIMASPKSVSEALQELRDFLNEQNSSRNAKTEHVSLNYIRYISRLTKDCEGDDKDENKEDDEFEGLADDDDDTGNGQ